MLLSEKGQAAEAIDGVVSAKYDGVIFPKYARIEADRREAEALNSLNAAARRRHERGETGFLDEDPSGLRLLAPGIKLELYCGTEISPTRLVAALRAARTWRMETVVLYYDEAKEKYLPLLKSSEDEDAVLCYWIDKDNWLFKI